MDKQINKAWIERIVKLARGLRARAEQPKPPEAASKWASPARHIEVLNSAACECGSEKKIGDYRCAPCSRGVQ